MIYPWTGSAEILGTITDPVWVFIDVVSFTPSIPGIGPDNSYFVNVSHIWSYDLAGNVFSFGDYGITVMQTSFMLNGTNIEISDSARFLTSIPTFAHGAGGATGTATLGIALPDGLSVANEHPIPAVPEPATWMLLIIGFIMLRSFIYAKNSLSHYYASLALPASASTITLGGVVWDNTNSGNVTLNAVVPGGNQPQNAPCLICGANQPQQPAGFGYNDFSNAGNVSAIQAFSDEGNGGRNTLNDDTLGAVNPGYNIGAGSLFLAFLLAHGDTANNLGFSIGVNVNDTNSPQTLNSFFLLDLTTHTVLSSFTGGTTGNVPSVNNGTGFPDYTLDGFTLNGVNPGDQIVFVARMTGLNDGPDSFFLEPGPLQPAVPEASTWIMMLLGFAGVGLTAMRKSSFRFA